MKLKIGIFDSGIGGFTVLNSLLKTRKDVEVFYLADTKRMPYGNRNPKEIRLIAKEICTFFVDKNLDALLVACYTTNACAFDILLEPQEFCKKEIKIINIDKRIFFFHIA